ncbi:uncharacterized protein [Elaeis guineensis]|uniref:Lissencephaly-1 homolog 1 isoform X2 n=1 Tax=Elaeis guineensis var. tenera TaxID=51953 RepID=A0A6I9RRS7_ELAGV|nr:lissencephaly-1 homolog 1 isoform X2 [Elaeis guineensis]
MLSSNEDGEVFFDACDSIRTSISSSEDSIFENEELEFRKFGYQLWTRELTSVQERRDKFLQEMGFYESVSSSSGPSQDHKEATDDSSKEHMDLARVTKSSGTVLLLDDRLHVDSLPSPDNGVHRDSVCCIRDLDSGKKFIVCDLGQDGLFSTLKEVGSDKLMTLQEFEALLGLSCSVQKLMRRDAASFGEKPDDVNKKKFKSWWRSFSDRRQAAGMCKSDVSVKNPKMRSMRTRVQQHKKRSMEFTALYMGQEIKAHKGLIRAMKFSPSGCYLASGGEDCIVRIWQIREVETSCECSNVDESSKNVDAVKDIKLHFSKKCSNSASVIIPKKVFKIEEAPLQEFYGHTGDILDLSWSKSDCLLTSSKDKTVRMWKVGCDGCLKVFRHNDYVTCVQFNPNDNKYFISGSIDGKVRIWGVPENRVVDWVDLRDIVTAISYRPDGKGFVVGCITGNCRFYNYSGQNMQLDSRLCIQGKKKSAGKRITSLQFSPKDSQRVMVTAGDAKVRIVDGFDVIHKFKGLRKAKSQLSASFTSDGRHIVSVGEDSYVYIWNYDSSGSLSSKGSKSIRACELFFSERASVAVPWPGLDHGQAGSGGKTLDASSLQQKILEASTCLRDPDCFSLGTWLFSDGSSRGSATWPEEKLSSTPKPSSKTESCHHHHCHLHHQYHSLTSMAAMWSLVIVTASHDGTIRSFHNYGLPVRL